MSQRILLYGATGFSGRLIADWALKRGDALVLASRDARALRRQAAAVKMAHIAFGLDDRRRVLRVLEGFDVVINAAGPFNQTAERLAKAAIETSCSYVDINGEIDVYKTLDDLGDSAERRGVTLVCGAGHTATISDILLDSALTELPADDIGAVRIAVSRSLNLSRGSTLTMLRSIREQVTIVRAGIDPDSGARTKELRLTHVPVGRLERTFDFSMQHDSEQQAPRFGRLIASASNLVDTLTARCTAARHKVTPDRIEAYIEMPAPLRFAYQLGALSAIFFRFPGTSQAIASQVKQLPEGPDRQERMKNRHRVVLEIEDRSRALLVDWRIETPDPYDFTARCAYEVAAELAEKGFKQRGWVTPSAALASRGLPVPSDAEAMEESALWHGCRLERRRPP